MNIRFLSRSPRTLSKDGSRHVTDEVVNTLISLTGLLLSIPGVIFLLKKALATDGLWSFTGCVLYGIGLVSVFLSSALHHGLDGPHPLEHRLRRLDYCAIFLLIAGSFTPFCLILFRNLWGFSLLAVVWITGLTGIFLSTRLHEISKGFFLGLFIGMGWLGAFLFFPVSHQLGWQGVFPMALGGALFTGGAVIYYYERPNPIPGRFGFHEIWHLMVLLGNASHFWSIYGYLVSFHR